MKEILINHEKAVKKDIFFTETKWPHFNLLFNDLKKLSKNKKKIKVLFLERSHLYGKLSLLAPYFMDHDVVSVDCTPKKLIPRGKYNKHLTINPDIIKFHSQYHCDYKKLNIKEKNFDLVIIPNLIHHISEHDKLFINIKKLLKKNGKLYIFEPLLRELHQKPEDYLRFTPFGLKNILKKNRFSDFSISEEGSIFTAITYCWDQALQYLPKAIREIEYKKFLKIEVISKKSI